LRQIETKAGRNRDERWAPRTLDIDLLLYDKLVIDTPELVVPHPRMAFRRFVLEPAAEAAGWMEHPTIGWTITKLRNHVRAGWWRYAAAIAGPIASGKTALATAIATTVVGRLISDPAPQRRFEEPAGDSDCSFEGEIKRLCLRRASLQFSKSSHSTVISDFWFEQTICDAKMELPANRFAEYLERCRLESRTVAKARLLVLLDVPPDVSWQRIGEHGDPHPRRFSRDWLVRYRELLLALVAIPGHGPVLRLDGTKLDEARDELVAAIQAMQ
jgi:deoxyadenosine/deoxycytidine kinase